MGQIQSTSYNPYNPPEAWRDTPPVERAAHLFDSFLPGRAAELCAEEGICIHDIDAGAKLADARHQAHALACQMHGAPEYGGEHQAEAEKKAALAEADARRERERRGEFIAAVLAEAFEGFELPVLIDALKMYGPSRMGNHDLFRHLMTKLEDANLNQRMAGRPHYNFFHWQEVMDKKDAAACIRVMTKLYLTLDRVENDDARWHMARIWGQAFYEQTGETFGEL